MKKPILIFFILTVILCSCKEGNNKFLSKRDVKPTISACDKENRIVLDTVFKNTPILTSMYYNENCKIQKLELITQLDERSGSIQSQDEIKNVSVITGFLGDTIHRFTIGPEDKLFHFNKKDNILLTELVFAQPFLDSINILELQTFASNEDFSDGKIMISDSYLYNNTAKLLDIDRTYLDYAAFKNQNINTKIISVKENTIDTLMITVQVNQIIDDIEMIDISLNKKVKLNYKSSIKADFKNFKRESNGCMLVSFLKMSPKFIQLKVDIEKADLKEISEIILRLNDVEYQ